MSWISSAFDHIPEAATSPLALIAYLAAVVAGVILTFQIARNRSHQKLISTLPEAKRDARVREIVGKPFPAKFSGEQWLRHKRDQFVLAGAGVLCATVVIIFAIAAATVPPNPVPPHPEPTDEPTLPPASPTAIEKDAALLDQFDLKLDKAYVRQLLGVPNWSTSAEITSENEQNYVTMPIEIYSKNGYNLTVGYDENDKVSIYSLVPTDDAFLKTTVPHAAAFNKTFQELAPDAFIDKDFSSKFYYYAEGHIGTTEADGHITEAFFYTDTGLEPEDQINLLPPSIESDGLSTGDAPVQSEDAKKWRTAARPNGYLKAREGVDISGIFFHNMDWKGAVA